MEKSYLAVANAYSEKYFLSDDFANLPSSIKEEIQLALVKFAMDIGGIIGLYFDANGDLKIELNKESDDFFYDDIGAELKVRELEKDEKDLFEGLEMYYKAVTGRLEDE